MPTTQANLLPSVFDRLADLSTHGPESPEWYDIAALTQSVRRDLEDLLNTHQSIPHLEKEFPHLAESVVGFGSPDASTFRLETPVGRRRMCAALTDLIHRFEPRLTNVRVELGGHQNEKFRDLRFRVIASLVVESAPQIIFESSLHIPTGQFRIGAEE